MDLIKPGELTDLTPDMAKVLVRHRLLAVVLYPGFDPAAEANRRNAEIQFNMAFLRSQPHIGRQDWWDRLIAPNFSLDVADGQGAAFYESEFVARISDWWPVGAALLQLMSARMHHDSDLRDGASLTKAMGVAAMALGKDSSGTLRKWADAKPVAHILAAIVQQKKYRDGGPVLPMLADVTHTLTFAHRMQRFLTEWSAGPNVRRRFDNARLPLAPDQIWAIADGGYPNLPLTDAQLVVTPMRSHNLEEWQRRTARKK